jgi:hypothetical protein
MNEVMPSTPTTQPVEARGTLPTTYAYPPPRSSYLLELNPLPQIDLAAVLKGDTKSPVSLEDFRDFLLKEDGGVEVFISLYAIYYSCTHKNLRH